MVVEVSPIFSTIAQAMRLSEADLVRQGVRALVERQLLQVNAQLLELHGKFAVSSVAQMEARYRDGTLEESDSWRDFQRLDHLEFERDRLQGQFEALACAWSTPSHCLLEPSVTPIAGPAAGHGRLTVCCLFCGPE